MSSVRVGVFGRAFGVVMVVALAVGACTSDGDRPSGAADSRPGRDDVVADIVDEVMVPAVRSAAELAGSAEAAAVKLCAAPDEATLESARVAVAAGWQAWRRTDSFDIGPAMDRRSSSLISYKVDTHKVATMLTSGPPTDPEAVRNRTGADLRGYGAAWFLLSSDATSFAQPERCGYLTAVLNVVAAEAEAVRDAWTDGVDGGEPYRATALGEGPDALGPTDVIDAVVNMQLSQLEATGKLLASAIEVEPGAPSGLPVAALFQLSAQVDGMVAVYEVGGLAGLLRPGVARRVASAFDAVETTLAPASSVPELGDPPVERLGEVAEQVEAARVVIATEVVSALDVTVSFSENDGDS